MKKAVKKMWVQALRSGKYTQGHSYLNNEAANTHCCLGVLCEIAAVVGQVEKRQEGGMSKFGISGISFVGNDVLDWAKLHSVTARHLVDLNDTDRKSFDEIADYIEAEL